MVFSREQHEVVAEQMDGDADECPEMWTEVQFGADGRWRAPDARLDALIDLVGEAATDIQRLLQEVRRLRARQE
jgi:hypothetical protein